MCQADGIMIHVQRDDGKVRSLRALWLRLSWRVRAGGRLAVNRVKSLRRQALFAGLIALVSLVLFAPVLLDDAVLWTGYLLRPAADAIEIVSPIELSQQPPVTIDKGTLSVPPALSGRQRTGDALAALVKGGNARLVLEGAVFHVALAGKAADEFGNNGFGTGLPGGVSPMLAALGDATFEKLTVKNATIHLEPKAGPDIVLANVNAVVVVKRKTAMRIKGTLALLGETVNFDATVGSRIDRRGGVRMPLKATVRSNPVTASIDGRLDWRGGPVLTASSAEIVVPNMRALARWLGPVWPSGPGLKDFSVAGGLDWSEGTIAVHKGVFRMDGNEASGELLLDLKGERPAISGTLAAGSFDLTPYLAAGPPPEEAGTSLMGRFKAARDLTLPLLGFINADARFSADKIRLGALEGERAALGLNLNDGRLLIDLADLAVPGGGQARGELTIEGWTTMPNYTIRGGVERASMPDVWAALTGTQVGSGRGNIAVDLKASGASGIDVLSKLDGKVGVELPSGGTVSCSVGSIAAAARAQQMPVEGPCATFTTVGPLKASAALTHGFLTLEPVEAMSGADRVRMTGSVDLLTRIMDLSASSQSGAGGDVSVTVRGRPEAPTLTVREP